VVWIAADVQEINFPSMTVGGILAQVKAERAAKLTEQLLAQTP
jgi:hypothetical protein